MKKFVTLRDLRNDPGAILQEVQAGRTFVITHNGAAVAELRPIALRRFVSRAAIAEAGRKAPWVDVRRLREDLDAVVDQSTDG